MNSISIDPDVNGLSPSRAEELSRWWLQSLDSIENYAYRELSGDRYIQRTLDYLHERLPQCKATCPSQLRRWAFRQIDKEAERLIPETDRSKRKSKPFEFYERNGTCHIPIVDSKGHEHLWKIDQDSIKIAEAIWPLHVKRYPNNKPFLAKHHALKWPGKRVQKVLPAHHIHLWFRYPEVSEADIRKSRARDDDFLNWSNGNIYLPCREGLAVCKAEREFRLKKAVYESSFKQFNFGSAGKDDYGRVRVNIDPKLIEKWERILDEDNLKRDIVDVAKQVDADLDCMPWYVNDDGERINLNKPTRPPGHDEEDEGLESYARSESI